MARWKRTAVEDAYNSSGKREKEGSRPEETQRLHTICIDKSIFLERRAHIKSLSSY